MAAKKSLNIGLTSTDICQIITTCAECGVTELTLADLCVKFDNEQIVDENVEITSPTIVPIVVDEEDDELVALKEAAELTEDMLDELKLTDPSEWERLILDDERDHG